MLFNLRVFLWGIVAELEYALYPWKDKSPPEEASKKYNLTDTTVEQHFQYDWIQSHDQKIVRLQEEMLWVQKEIHKLNVQLKTHD